MICLPYRILSFNLAAELARPRRARRAFFNTKNTENHEEKALLKNFVFLRELRGKIRH
jgi:hypothetical protein